MHISLLNNEKRQSFGIRLLTYIVIGVTICFYTLALTGCVSNSPGLPNLFLLKVGTSSKTAHGTAGAEIRIGYFGVCAGSASTLQCQPTANRNITSLQALVNTSSGDSSAASPLIDILPLVQTLQTKIFLPVIAVAGVFYVIGLLLFLKASHAVRQATEVDGGKRWKHYTLAALGLSTAFGLASAVATNEAAGVAQVLAHSHATHGLIVSAGIALQVLQWLAFSFSFLVVWGMLSVLSEQEATGGAILPTARSMPPAAGLPAGIRAPAAGAAMPRLPGAMPPLPMGPR